MISLVPYSGSAQWYRSADLGWPRVCVFGAGAVYPAVGVVFVFAVTGVQDSGGAIHTGA